jgi:hypothetical protein
MSQSRDIMSMTVGSCTHHTRHSSHDETNGMFIVVAIITMYVVTVAAIVMYYNW